MRCLLYAKTIFDNHSVADCHYQKYLQGLLKIAQDLGKIILHPLTKHSKLVPQRDVVTLLRISRL